MRVVTKPSEYVAVLDLLMEYFEKDTRAIIASTQKDRAREEGRKAGYKEAIGEGVAAVLTEVRCKRFNKHDVIPVIDGYEVIREVINPSVDLYGLWKAAPGATDEERVQRQAQIDEFVQRVGESLETLINDEHLVQSELKRHRDAVLKGEEDATEDDKEWIQSELDDHDTITNRLRSVLEK